MNVLELINDTHLNLPVERCGRLYDGLTFPQFVVKKIQEYNTLISELENFGVGDTFQTAGVDNNLFIKHLVYRLNGGIIKAIFSYYRGNPIKAYNEIDNVLSKSVNPLENIIEYIFSTDITNDKRLFRIRRKRDENPFLKRELFHVPYEDRYKITTKRFSIAGFPSLYLSNSIFTAAVELQETDLSILYGSRFEIDTSYTTSFRVLNLTNQIEQFRKKYIVEGNPIDGFIIRFLVTWPLLMASSIKVLQNDKPFIPEYIIPQLILLWTRMNGGGIEGVKYSSSKISISDNNLGEFYNVVVPCKVVAHKGYCSYLTKVFKMTKPKLFINDSTESRLEHFRIKHIELNGNRVDYCTTEYAMFENQLLMSSMENLME